MTWKKQLRNRSYEYWCIRQHRSSKWMLNNCFISTFETAWLLCPRCMPCTCRPTRNNSSPVDCGALHSNLVFRHWRSLHLLPDVVSHRLFKPSSPFQTFDIATKRFNVKSLWSPFCTFSSFYKSYSRWRFGYWQQRYITLRQIRCVAGYTSVGPI